MDACTQLSWAEVTWDIKLLSAMTDALKGINLLNADYGIRLEALFIDNGPEMTSPRNNENHLMKRMIKEMGIRHRCVLGLSGPPSPRAEETS